MKLKVQGDETKNNNNFDCRHNKTPSERYESHYAHQSIVNRGTIPRNHQLSSNTKTKDKKNTFVHSFTLPCFISIKQTIAGWHSYKSSNVCFSSLVAFFLKMTIQVFFEDDNPGHRRNIDEVTHKEKSIEARINRYISTPEAELQPQSKNL